MKYFLTVILFFSFQFVKGQLIMSGSIDAIANAHKTNLLIDWSRVKIAGMDVEEWISYRQKKNPEQDARIELEEQLKPLFHQVFLPNCNKSTYERNFILVRNQKTPYTLTIIPISIEENGTNTCEYEFTETESGTSLLKVVMKIRGGMIGSISNLWSYAFEDAGDDFGAFLDKALKKARKKKK